MRWSQCALALTLQVVACGNGESKPGDGSTLGGGGQASGEAGSSGATSSSSGGHNVTSSSGTGGKPSSGGASGSAGNAAGGGLTGGAGMSAAGGTSQSAGTSAGGAGSGPRGAASLDVPVGNGCALDAASFDFPEVASGHPVSQLERSGVIANGATSSSGVRVKVVCRWTTSKEPHGFDASIALGTNGNTVSIGAKGLAKGMVGQGNLVLDGPDLPGSYGAPVSSCAFDVIEIDAATKSVWGKLSCPKLEDTESGNTCTLADSFFAFENCTSP